MADWLPRQYKESHPGWIVAGIVVMLAGVPLLIVGEAGWGFLSLAVGAAWIGLGALGMSERK